MPKSRQQFDALLKQGDWQGQRRCGKVGFPSRKVASARAKALSGKTGASWEAYSCSTCGKYHVGHTRRQ
jgi:hypothetical protein